MEPWKARLCSGNDVLGGLLALDAALRRMEDHRDLVPVLGALLQSDDLEIKRRSSWFLGKMGQNKKGDADVIPFLLSLATDEDDEVRENCAWGIGEFAGAGVGDERCLQAIELLMRDANRDVRGMAAWALGRLADKMSLTSISSAEVARSLLDDESPYVRKSAAFALERIEVNRS
jgi:HEAT repeat protein